MMPKLTDFIKKENKYIENLKSKKNHKNGKQSSYKKVKIIKNANLSQLKVNIFEM